MAKDYAKRAFTTTRTPQKKWRRIELFIIPVIVLGCLLGYWVFAHKTEMMAENVTFLDRVTGLFKHKEALANHSMEDIKAVSTIKKSDDVHFDFYSELPNMQMSAFPEMAESAPSKIIIPKPNIHDPEASQTAKAKQALKYIVRLGEFNDSVSASQHQLSLLLVGCDAEIVAIKTANKTLFRVQRGPFVEEAQAKQLQQRLLQKGVESTLVKA